MAHPILDSVNPRLVWLLWAASIASAAEWGITVGVPLHGPVISTNFPSFFSLDELTAGIALRF